MKPIAALVCVLVVCGLLLIGCGRNPTPHATTTPEPSLDPYASLTAREVLDTFMAAYQRQQFDTCLALFSPGVRGGMSSPDSFALDEQATIRKYGTIIRWDVTYFSDDGAIVYANVLMYRTTDPTQALQSRVQLQRISRTWKVSSFGY